MFEEQSTTHVTSAPLLAPPSSSTTDSSRRQCSSLPCPIPTMMVMTIPRLPSKLLARCCITQQHVRQVGASSQRKWCIGFDQMQFGFSQPHSGSCSSSTASYSFFSTTTTTTAVAATATTDVNARHTSSVSDLEISKFSKLSKTWWDPKQNPLMAMNPIRVKYIVDHVVEQQKMGRLLAPDASAGTGAGGTETDQGTIVGRQLSPLTGLRALDIGCGGGLLAESLARLGATVTAIDPSTALVEEAKLHSKLHPLTRAIDYRGGWTVEQLAAETESLGTKFDIICLSEVIEHVTDADAILSAVTSLLKKSDGTLFVSTLNRTCKSQILAIIGAEYIMRYVPTGTHDWNQFRSPEEVQVLMERAGLTQVDVTGMVFDAPPLLLRQQWNWRLTPDDMDMNWIGAYGHATISGTAAAEEKLPTNL